ncbi:aa3-type cytochrome c oxidase subunit IV [Tepidamorphus sp. 3E244]|uniref:aa3-type cytochrome c oxidase subunit IV n=1 Tax=Tepidamorphus sp. 3E244 TaxID=3385498 RepID=UPI0038FC7B0D
MAGSDHTETAMDYVEHDRTYEGFLEFSKVGSIACLNILVALVYVHLGHWILGLLMVAGLVFTAVIGIAFRPKGYMVGVVQLVLGLILMALIA